MIWRANPRQVLYSSRGLSDYEDVLDERRSMDSAIITPEVMERAIELQHELARRGQHRLPIPDLVISAAAQAAGIVVLHYDSGFERIAAAGGAGHEWGRHHCRITAASLPRMCQTGSRPRIMRRDPLLRWRTLPSTSNGR